VGKTVRDGTCIASAVRRAQVQVQAGAWSDARRTKPRTCPALPRASACPAARVPQAGTLRRLT
jgi:hypothetical protein